MPANRSAPETDWAALRREVIETFTPGTPINESDLFAGRQNTIQKLQDITIELGRHAIIYGERGVGKTSLANIFHRSLNSPTRRVHAIRINGDSSDTFDSLWRKVFRRIKLTEDDVEIWADQTHERPITPDDVQLELSSFSRNDIPIVIIDEYDRVLDDECKVLMTDAVKALSDYSVGCTLVIVGVADSVTELIHDHASISRPLVQVHMKRMTQAELSDIVTTRIQRLRMTISGDALWRIGFFSAGLPFYAHSFGKHAAMHSIEDRRLRLTEQHVSAALSECMEDVDYSIRESYVRATERIYRKTNIFPQVLAACALAEPNELGQFTAAAVEIPLSEIMEQTYKTPSFAFHLNEMCGPDRGSVLRKTGERRTYQYHFAEPIMQPYVVMKSLEDAIISDALLERFSIQRQRRLSI